MLYEFCQAVFSCPHTSCHNETDSRTCLSHLWSSATQKTDGIRQSRWRRWLHASKETPSGLCRWWMSQLCCSTLFIFSAYLMSSIKLEMAHPRDHCLCKNAGHCGGSLPALFLRLIFLTSGQKLSSPSDVSKTVWRQLSHAWSKWFRLTVWICLLTSLLASMVCTLGLCFVSIALGMAVALYTCGHPLSSPLYCFWSLALLLWPLLVPTDHFLSLLTDLCPHFLSLTHPLVPLSSPFPSCLTLPASRPSSLLSSPLLVRGGKFIISWQNYPSTHTPWLPSGLATVLDSFISAWHKLGLSERREPQLGKCLHKTQL